MKQTIPLTDVSRHACECGVLDEPAFPEFDVRTVPHAIRHATVFGALDSLHPGGGLILIAPHDPLPLLAQIEDRAPGRFTVEYLDRGPWAWRIQLVHTVPAETVPADSASTDAEAAHPAPGL